MGEHRERGMTPRQGCQEKEEVNRWERAKKNANTRLARRISRMCPAGLAQASASHMNVISVAQAPTVNEPAGSQSTGGLEGEQDGAQRKRTIQWGLQHLRHPHADVEIAFVAGGFTGSTWIADSGASTHIGNVDDGMMDVEDVNDPVKVGNGNQVRLIKKGTLPLMPLQKNGDTMDMLLEDHKHAPDFDVCLFSLMKSVEKGWTLSNKGTNVMLTKKNTTIAFDWITKTKDGILCGVESLPRIGEQATPTTDVQEPPESESGGEGTQNADDPAAEDSNSNSKSKPKPKPVCWNVNRFHKVFGHASNEAMKSMAKHFVWKLTGTLEACEDCQMSNAQQKRVSKTTKTQSETPGERLFVDMSSVSKHKSLGGARAWLAASNDATGHTWSHPRQRI